MTYWAVLCDCFICHWTVKRTRRDAIAEFMDNSYKKTWRQWKAEGYRCRKVKIEVQP